MKKGNRGFPEEEKMKKRGGREALSRAPRPLLKRGEGGYFFTLKTFYKGKKFVINSTGEK